MADKTVPVQPAKPGINAAQSDDIAKLTAAVDFLFRQKDITDWREHMKKTAAGWEYR